MASLDSGSMRRSESVCLACGKHPFATTCQGSEWELAISLLSAMPADATATAAWTKPGYESSAVPRSMFLFNLEFMKHAVTEDNASTSFRSSPTMLRSLHVKKLEIGKWPWRSQIACQPTSVLVGLVKPVKRSAFC